MPGQTVSCCSSTNTASSVAIMDRTSVRLRDLDRPAVTVLHTVLPRPSTALKEVTTRIAADSYQLIVMCPTAARLLFSTYDVPRRDGPGRAARVSVDGSADHSQ